MKKLLLTIAFAGLLTGLASLGTGCASVSVAGEGDKLVIIQNSGCFLFSWMPLCSGDPDYPNEEVSSWFDNTVHPATNIRLLEEEAARRGTPFIRNIATHTDDETILWLILKRKICRTSAELTGN